MTEDQNTSEENQQITTSPMDAPQWSSGGPMDDSGTPEEQAEWEEQLWQEQNRESMRLRGLLSDEEE